MSSKVLFSCDYPIYSVGRLGDGGAEFFVAGGGGRAKTGIPNSLDIHRLCVDDGGGCGCGSEALLHHDMGTGVIMNSATHPINGNQLAVGVGGECLSLEMTQKRDSHKKESKVKRRKKSKSDEEDSGVSKVVVSREVVVTTRTQTDFSSECYQKTVAFSCHGDRVVTGGSDCIVRVWKYPSLDKVCELKGHENEIETLSCHPSKEQAVSMCRGGKGVVWDLVNEDQEHWFTWTPGQLHTGPSEAKPTYRFRACCFSPNKKESEEFQTSLYTLTIPMDTRSKMKRCYLVKWDAGAWIVDDEISTGTELLSALAIDTGGRYLGVGTISGSILVYSSDLKLISKVAAVHTVFVTGLLFLPLPTKKLVPSSGKQVSKQEKLVLISVSADRTCSATLVKHKSGRFTFIFLFIIMSLLLLLIAVTCKHYQIW